MHQVDGADGVGMLHREQIVFQEGLKVVGTGNSTDGGGEGLPLRVGDMLMRDVDDCRDFVEGDWQRVIIPVEPA